MKYAFIILAAFSCLICPVAAQQELPTKDQYFQQEISNKISSVGALLDEVHKLKTEVKRLTTELETAKGEAKK